MTLQPFGQEIWFEDGPAVSFFGVPYPTRMAIIRLSGGSLFVWSPVALSPALQRCVEALGTVQILVTPNHLHHLSLLAWQAAYPQARLYAPRGLRRRRKDLAFDGDLLDRPEPAWAADIDQVVVRGSPLLTEVVFFHRASGTAIFGDLIQSLSPKSLSGWRRVLARAGGILAPDVGAPRDLQLSFLDRRAARRSLERILDWPIERVLIAHGEPAAADGAGFVRFAFRWLLA